MTGSTGSPLSCVLVGSDALLVDCAEIWRAHGLTVAGVLTDGDAPAEWAVARGIPVAAPGEALPAPAPNGSVDVLLSVTNFTHKPRNLGLVPRLAAINYHDGPLPTYGGFNATAWALMAREPRHGVTWHTWSDRIDEGDILAQRVFDLAPNETSLTLNARCYEAALDSFRELVERLRDGALGPRAQRPDAATFRPRHARPKAASTIDWSRSAREIDALIRALDMGPYPNRLGLAKMLVRGELLAVVRAEPAPNTAGVERAAPGAVLAVDGDRVIVATGDGTIALTAVSTLSGDTGSAAVLLGTRGVAPGMVLASPNAALAGRLAALDATVVDAEPYWAARLSDVRWLAAPDRLSFGGPDAPVTSRPVALAPHDLARTVAAAVSVLTRFGSGSLESADVAIADGRLRDAVSGLEPWFSRNVPARMPAARGATLSAYAALVRAALGAALDRGPYARDLVLRRGTNRTAPGAAPVVIELDADPAAFALPADATIALLIAPNAEVAWWVVRSPVAAERLARSLAAVLEAAVDLPDASLAALPCLTRDERDRVLHEWNDTARAPAWNPYVHVQFAGQAARTPNETALVCDGNRVTYAELYARVAAVAAGLRRAGVTTETLVGICFDRSVDLVVAMLAVLGAGGAYVPLDPAYPRARLVHQITDAAPLLVLACAAGRRALGTVGVPVRSLGDVECAPDPARAMSDESTSATGSQLAYVLYTSGSTGTPKGVMVEHRNVTNLFAAFDERLGIKAGGRSPGVWLAVTSTAFDISVLELLWTLARGFTVVVLTGDPAHRAVAPAGAPDLSLFYFSSDEGEHAADKYKLLLDGARFADTNGFAAVWTPERHLHPFGGLYPSPSVAAAAIAAVTERVAIRAGSVVLPLHSPIRVAEEWSVVDNISGGRAGIAFAPGWQPNDFVLRPESFADSRGILVRDLDVVRRLWRGEAVTFPNGTGQPVDVRTFPRPVQRELPFWITTAGNPESFRAAGRLGANILTNLLGQRLEDLAEKLAVYRAAWREAGHPGDGGRVTLMLHTFVGASDDEVREHVRGPLIEYLKTSLGLIKQYAWSYPAFRNRATGAADAMPELSNLSADELDGVLAHAFDRYYESSGLFGTVERAADQASRVHAMGVHEIACLIDFGVSSDVVLSHLTHLASLREKLEHMAGANESIAGLITRHGVTHMQCTPSLASLLLESTDGCDAIGRLDVMLVGGEAVSPSLADALARRVRHASHDVYGPTETTVWSTTHRLTAGESPVPIGRPLANTSCYVLDENGQPLPSGVRGELWIGGAGVARGYKGRADLTASRFVTDPFVARSGTRMYRTGDEARWRDDGVLEFLGRSDSQVKIRGHRIEMGEVESVLAADPRVREAVVIPAAGHDGALAGLTAYVVPRTASGAAATEARLDLWRATYDDAYMRSASDDAGSSTAGWVSSYTGEPIPDDEMREWADASAERVLRHRPGRVLEIGCGTGLLLTRIAPHCERYDALDFSAAALERAAQHAHALDLGDKITLRQCAAHELDGFPQAVYDVVVLNSVVQYFPDADYLRRVIRAAARRLRPEGVIVVGDVRSLPLLDAFHTSVAISHGVTNPGAQRDAVRRRVLAERELVLDPRIFALPGLRVERVEPRRGVADNEMTRFRYDVTLRLTNSDDASEETGEVWDGGCNDAASLRARLAAERPQRVRVYGVTDGRSAPFAALARTIESNGSSPCSNDCGTHPESLWSLANDLPYQVDVMWSGDLHTLEAVFTRKDAQLPRVAWRAETPSPGTPLANEPAGYSGDDDLAASLCELARERLPAVMVPSRCVIVDAIPRTPNGKTDRAALAALEGRAPPRTLVARETSDRAPTDPLERTLCDLWRDVLGVKAVSPSDDFFALGGHSLLAVRIHRRMSELLQRPISLSSIFKYPVLRDLAASLRGAPSAEVPAAPPTPALRPLPRTPRRDPPARGRQEQG